jgi:hypothetical protein
MPHSSCGHASAPAKGAHAPLRISRRQSSRAVCQRLPRRRPQRKRAAAPTTCSQAATPAAVPTRPLLQPSRQQGAAVPPAPALMQHLLQAAVGAAAPGRAAPGRPLHPPAPTRHSRAPTRATAAFVHPQQPVPTRYLRAPAPAATASPAAPGPTSTLLSAVPASTRGRQRLRRQLLLQQQRQRRRGRRRRLLLPEAGSWARREATSAAAASRSKVPGCLSAALKLRGRLKHLASTECIHVLHSTRDLAVSDVQRWSCIILSSVIDLVLQCGACRRAPLHATAARGGSCRRQQASW